jgi:hypothetical protein
MSAGAPSAQALMRDPSFASAVEAEWSETKARIKAQAKAERIGFKKDVGARYAEARKIAESCERFKTDMQWDNAFYCLHLYLECVLEPKFMLHRQRKTAPLYVAEARECHATLLRVEGELDLVMRGIRSQIIEKHRLEVAAAGATLKPPSSPKAPAGAGASAASASASASTSAAAAATLAIATPSALSQPDLDDAPKRFSHEEARAALDALRIDGKRTQGVKLYGMDIGAPSAPPAPPAPAFPVAAAPAPALGPPPSYQEAIAGGMTGYLNTRTSRQSLNASPGNMRVKKVLGDGNCAFRSMAQGSARGELDAASELRIALKLRHAACEELRRCADEEMTGTGLTVEQLVLMKDERFASFTDYIAGMARSDYAGETEFWLLARKLQMSIAIFQPKHGGYEHMITYGSEEEAEPVRLLWQRGSTEAGNHYDSLLTA